MEEWTNGRMNALMEWNKNGLMEEWSDDLIVVNIP